jgi:hypothetical protein
MERQKLAEFVIGRLSLIKKKSEYLERLISPSGLLRASDREVNAPEETHLEVVRHVAAVRTAPRRWIDVRAVI